MLCGKWPGFYTILLFGFYSVKKERQAAERYGDRGRGWLYGLYYRMKLRHFLGAA